GAGWMAEAPPPEAVRALRRPTPPLAFGLALDVATAAMDLSDGIGSDTPRLAAASGVALDLDAASLPAHPAIAGAPELLRWQVSGGEDYQLLFTAPPEARGRVEALAGAHQVAVHRIGVARAGEGVTLTAPWPDPAFAHFRGDDR
ncbi:MAG: AIR synthase-related protein, partial [Myxococcota bacterium]